MQAETPARTHKQASSLQTRLFAGAAVSQPGAWPPPGQGSRGTWHPTRGWRPQEQRERKDGFPAAPLEQSGLARVTETPKLLCKETPQPVHGDRGHQRPPLPPALAPASPATATAPGSPLPSSTPMKEGWLMPSQNAPDPRLYPGAGDNGTASWLQVTHPASPDPPNPKYMGRGQLCQRFRLPPCRAWPCFEASPAPSGARPQTPRPFHPPGQRSPTAASGRRLLASLPARGEQWLWDGGPTALALPIQLGRSVLTAWEAGTDRHPLLRGQVRCSWYPAQTGSGVPHKQTPPTMKPAGSAPGGRPVSLQIAAIKGLLWRKNPLCCSLSRVLVCAVMRGWGGICPQSLLPCPCS